LRRIINTVRTFTDSDQCIQFLTSINDRKAFVIISGALGQRVVPVIHEISQLDAVFIFCGNKSRHEQWAKEWPKIKSVSTNINDICEHLKQTIEQCNEDVVSISFIPKNDGASKQSLDRLDPSFMYTLILKEILLSIDFGPHDLKQFIDYCRQMFHDNEKELVNVKKLERNYPDQSPIWWYSYECFLYPMLNRSLRTMDVGIIIKMGFFIRDLHRQIEQLHKEQFSDQDSSKTFIVYRGQGLSITDFKQMQKLKGGVLSFNNILSTSQDRSISLDFARHALAAPNSYGVLFQMTINPAKLSVPFASVREVGYSSDDNEILFSMHTIFRIGEIKQIDKNDRLWQVELTFTSDIDPRFYALTDHIRQEIDGPTKWHRLGKYLLKLGQFDVADGLYQSLLEQATDERGKSILYNQLGLVRNGRGEYKEAIQFYEKALEIRQKSLPPNHPDLAQSYNNIGLVYQNMKEYSKALSFHEKALKIRQQSLPPNHADLAQSYNDIGLAYQNMEEYSKGLSYHEKALEIRQKNLPPNHPDLAESYHNIGSIYKNMGQHSKALSFCERAVECGQYSLPANHPSLQIWQKTLDLVKKNYK
jgi:tetratricopeptide (TPR) repeat protein